MAVVAETRVVNQGEGEAGTSRHYRAVLVLVETVVFAIIGPNAADRAALVDVRFVVYITKPGRNDSRVNKVAFIRIERSIFPAACVGLTAVRRVRVAAR